MATILFLRNAGSRSYIGLRCRSGVTLTPALMLRYATLALCATLAAPALAGAQSASRGGDRANVRRDSSPEQQRPHLDIGGQLRARAEAYVNGGFRPDNSDQYVLTRVLLHAALQAGPLASLYVEGMDARGPWKNKLPEGAPFRDHADLRQLILQLWRPTDPVMVRAGRLELFFGDGRLVGPLAWANTARTFDGARATITRGPLRVDAFGASVVRIQQDRFDRNIPGNNFYGVYGSLTNLAPKTAVEPFIFWRRQSGVTSESGVRGVMNFGTYGFRAFGKSIANFDYDAQAAVQRGSISNGSIAAWAEHSLVGYTIRRLPLAPRLFAEYNRASGDANPTDNRKTTFDQLYPTGHDKYGLTDLVGWQNMKHVRGGLDVAFPRGWSATTRYSSYWLADSHDALYNGGGAVLARSTTGNQGTYVGNEIDGIVSGKIVSGLSFSGGIGYFKPGTFLRNTTPGNPYTYPYAMLTYDF